MPKKIKFVKKEKKRLIFCHPNLQEEVHEKKKRFFCKVAAGCRYKGGNLTTVYRLETLTFKTSAKVN